MAVFSFPSKKRTQLSAILNGADGLDYLKAMTAEHMLSEADRLLKNSQRQRALEVIRRALDKQFSNQATPVEDFLRAPFLLQKAGRKTEGWMTLMEIKDYFYEKSEQEQFPDYKMLDIESKISSAMSRFLLQEKKCGYALYMAIKSYFEETTSTFYMMNAYMQKEITEKNPAIKRGYITARKQAENYMNIRISDSYISNSVLPNLIRARQKDKTSEIVALMKEYISHIPKIDYIKLEEDVMGIIQR
mgnify:CR=1 FL=1